MSSSLIDAFARFGAKPKNRLRGRSAIAGDGALVLSCAMAGFRHSEPGVLRYEDAVSRGPNDQTSAVLLGQHLVLARDEQLPVRMIVIAESREGNPRYRIYARPDVVGRLIEFDGDRFIVDFRRQGAEVKEPEVGSKRRG